MNGNLVHWGSCEDGYISSMNVVLANQTNVVESLEVRARRV